MKMNKVLLGIIGLAAATTLAACGNSSSSANAKVDAIKKAKVLKVAVSPDYPPFEFQTIQNGKNTVVGSDIDLANAIGKKLGVKVNIETMDFNNVLAAVQSGKADLAISAISNTPARAKAFDFSDSYYNPANTLVVKKTNLDKYTKLSDFSGKQLTAQKGSIQEGVVTSQFKGATLVSLPQLGDEINEVKGGMVQGAVMEDLIAKSYVGENSDLAISPIKLGSSNEDFSVAMAKNSGNLKSEINDLIKSEKANGQIDKSIQDNYKLSQQAK